MYTQFYTGATMKTQKKAIEAFLHAQGLTMDSGTQFTAVVYDDNGEIAATGSLEKNILKCIAVSENYRGEGLSATIVSALCAKAFEAGEKTLLLFTKPKNAQTFAEFGFVPLAKTQDMLLMENPRGTLDKFIAGLERGKGDCGAVVANCNPFTLGHRYLIETAASQCETLHLFVLSEDKSLFATKDRIEMVKRGTADLKNVLVHPTSHYLVSAATFPTYFLKQQQIDNNASGALDLEIFGTHFAPALNIKKRFVGEEPFSEITALYNRQMHDILPKFGIEVIEIPRKELGDVAISATRVRALLQENKYREIGELVPKTTLDYVVELFK